MLNLSGIIDLSIRNLHPDTAVRGSKMKAAELVCGTVVTDCIIRHTSYGNVETLSGWRGDVFVAIYPRLRHTAHTKQGFVDVQITTKPVQFSAYIHTEHLERFMGNAAICAIRSCLGK